MNPHPQSQKLWSLLRNPKCDACGLCEQAQTVCLLGDGPVPCDGLVIGEGPGFREDDVRIPFSGKSGLLLRRSLKEIGLDPRTLFITNVVACRPPGNRTPTRSEIKTCSNLYLVPQIQAVKPKAILLLGNTAVMFAKGRKAAVTKLEGTTFTYNGITCVPCRHPASLLRAEGSAQYPFLIQQFKQNLGLFKKALGLTEEKRFEFEESDELLSDMSLAGLFPMKPKYVYDDIETNGLNPFRKEAKIHCMALTYGDRNCSFRILPKHEDRLKVMLNSIPIMAHRGTFEGIWLKTMYGVTPRIYMDTKLGAHLMNENEPTGLKYQCLKYLDVEPWDEEQDWQNPDWDKMLPYNARDSKYGDRLYKEVQLPFLRKHPKMARLLRYILLPAEEVLIEMIVNGFHINVKDGKEKLIKCQEEKKKWNDKLNEIAGYELNPGSPNQMRKFLYQELELECPIMTKPSKKHPEGQESTGEPALLRLKGQHEAVDIELEWRKWQKYDSTYLTPWLTNGPILHANYDPTGTDTGRNSSSMVKNKRGEKGLGAVIHQCPRDPFVRNLITARHPDWCVVAGDLSQIQLRLVAHAANDPTMIEIFHRDSSTPEGDIHYQTATSLHTGEVTKELRKKAKAVNFGFVFGMFPPKFRKYAFENFDLKLSKRDSEDYRHAFFNKYDMLESWHRRVEAFVSQNGWIDSVLGRRRNLPDAKHDSGVDEWIRREAVRMGINSPIQADESAIIMFIMALLGSYSLPWEAKVDRSKVLFIGTAHDSILFECHKKYVRELKERINFTIKSLPRLFMHYFNVKFKVPILMDINAYEDCWEGKVMNV